MKNWVLPAAGVVLIAAGVFGFTKGEVSYTKEEHEASLGALELSFKEKESVNIPKWAAGGAIAVGALLILFGKRS